MDSEAHAAECRIRALTKKIQSALEAGDPERAEGVNKELLATKAELPVLKKRDEAARLARWTPDQLAEARKREECIEMQERELARIECEYRRLRRSMKVVMLPSRPQARARGAGAPAFGDRRGAVVLARGIPAGRTQKKNLSPF